MIWNMPKIEKQQKFEAKSFDAKKDQLFVNHKEGWYMKENHSKNVDYMKYGIERLKIYKFKPASL